MSNNFNFPPNFDARAKKRLAFACVLAVSLIGLVTYWYASPSTSAAPVEKVVDRAFKVGTDEIQITNQQATEVLVGPVESRAFEQRRDAVGMIDFNQDQTLQVFSPYQGRIGKVLVKAGDTVTSNQVLYTVLVPDLAQAAAALISTAGNLKTVNETLFRARSLYEAQSIPLKELQQNTSDQQAAEAAYRAARKTLGLFGLFEQDIDQIESQRKVDTEMSVRSPLSGRITARSAAPGQLVQPGSAPAPVSVSNMQKLWMIASVPEAELDAFRLGQKVAVTVQAYPQTVFSGNIVYIGDVADPVTHRIALRAEIADLKHQLRPQMLASFRITLAAPQSFPAVPVNALAREGDGSFSVWVTDEGLRFKRRTVAVGMTQDGLSQVTKGLAVGEKIARDKALYLSNFYSMATN
jgi:cobalt-zinc-cadmium efflux system membrane fusion protein